MILRPVDIIEVPLPALAPTTEVQIAARLPVTQNMKLDLCRFSPSVDFINVFLSTIIEKNC